MTRSILWLMVALGGSASAAPACPVPGELVQWRADYCLFKIGTDDLIAAGPCMAREAKTPFPNSCEGKLHYKRKLCRLVIGAGQRTGSMDSCVADPLFPGPTVRNGGA